MKTPTIIVRLIGIYLLTNSVITLIQIGRMASMQQAMPAMLTSNIPQNPMLGDMQIYAWIGIIVGLVATVIAGVLARLLTFDSEEPKKNPSLRDQLL